MPRRARYLGKGQIAVCMRSGIKCHASELVRDGRIPSLLVLPEWADPPQPQERPYVPDDLEGAPPFTPSPDQTPSTPPGLDAAPDPTQTFVILEWTAAEFIAGPRIESYDIYRDEGDGFTILDTIVVEYDMFGAIEGPDLTYNDEDVVEGVTYTYRVVANGDPVGSLRSNTAEVTMPAPVGAPTLTATLNLTTVELSWTDLVNATADTFLLYRAEVVAGIPGPYELIYSGAAFTFDDDPTAAIYRYYVVGQYNGADFDSNTQDANVPAAPTAVVLSGEQNGANIDLSWTASTATGGSITGYRLYKSVDGGAFGLLVDQVGLTYTDTDTPDGHTYSYYVVAHDSNGFSSPDSNTLVISIAVTSETITSSRTWVKPQGLVSLTYRIIGGGGGGGSGRHVVAGSTTRGGEGGGGGEYRTGTLLASALGATEDVVIGSGGAGSAENTGPGNFDGIPGTDGGASSFGAHVTANGGHGGDGGGASTSYGGRGGSGGSGGSGENGAPGSTQPLSATPLPGGSTTNSGPGGGGGGGSGSAPGTNVDGAPGGSSAAATGGAGGVAATASTIATAGASGSDAAASAAGGGGGGGGSGKFTTIAGGQSGGRGGNGGTYGAGGGGGGGAQSSGNGGGGGDGADGVLILEYTY